MVSLTRLALGINSSLFLIASKPDFVVCAQQMRRKPQLSCCLIIASVISFLKCILTPLFNIIANTCICSNTWSQIPETGFLTSLPI